ncbi:MAG: exodeoxyribonuclease VII large subunit [Lentisphaerae bacterium]|nr:exodeoxyribonuclease VII large subunit [Lentisphaerota bacterium]MCP4103542.1 exodeoxyribonuclease VII large subunit [Lentisphaerota bacterium]
MTRTEKVWKISEVNSAVRELVENSLLPFWLRGEVGTLNVHRSGHVYMTLKDTRSQLRAVFFGGAQQARQMNLKVGDEVEVFGKLTVYEVRGEYQLSVRQIRPVGLGDLQRRFEELKRKLSAEGLFDESRKKPIPVLPEKVGVITSADGAAIRDFLQVIERRFPNMHIRIYPAAVQGNGAERQVAAGVDYFNRINGADVIVVTRGGGSMEDLWPFNEEVLARAIAASEIPVISAVGHEIDFTISDFVADMRVPTPSAAAELVVGKREEFEQHLDRSEKDLRSSIQFLLQEVKMRLDNASNSYVFREPVHLVHEKQQYVDEMSRILSNCIDKKLVQVQNQMQLLTNRLQASSPAKKLKDCSNELSNLQEKLYDQTKLNLNTHTAKLNILAGKLDTLGPQSVLKRGFSILRDPQNGEIITSCQQQTGKKLEATLADGKLNLKVLQGHAESSPD